MTEKVENRRSKLKGNKCGHGTRYFEPLFDSTCFTFVKFMEWTSSLLLSYFLPEGGLDFSVNISSGNSALASILSQSRTQKEKGK